MAQIEALRGEIARLGKGKRERKARSALAQQLAQLESELTSTE